MGHGSTRAPVGAAGDDRHVQCSVLYDSEPWSNVGRLHQALRPSPFLWAYASIYMSCVAYIMFRMLAGVRGAPRQYIAIRIGAWGVAAASILEVVYLTLRVVDARPAALVEAIGNGFVIPFYGGVIVMALGMAGFAFVTRTRNSVLVALRVLLLRANTRRGLRTESAEESAEDAYDAYRLAVRLTDIANSEPLNRRERAILGRRRGCWIGKWALRTWFACRAIRRLQRRDPHAARHGARSGRWRACRFPSAAGQEGSRRRSASKDGDSAGDRCERDAASESAYGGAGPVRSVVRR